MPSYYPDPRYHLYFKLLCGRSYYFTLQGKTVISEWSANPHGVELGSWTLAHSMTNVLRAPSCWGLGGGGRTQTLLQRGSQSGEAAPLLDLSFGGSAFPSWAAATPPPPI